MKNLDKKFEIKAYEDFNWRWLTAFEQIVNNGIATYYLIDYGAQRVVIFNQYWIYQNYKKLPKEKSGVIKYIGGYFYLSSDDYFYKTNHNFDLIGNPYKSNSTADYRQFDYDSNKAKFYVAAYQLKEIHVFNESCSFLYSIRLKKDVRPCGLAIYNGHIYIGLQNAPKFIILKEETEMETIDVTECTEAIVSISFDSFGYMILSCYDNKLILVYDSEGKYVNANISTNNNPFLTSIDSRGRFIVITQSSLNIYY